MEPQQSAGQPDQGDPPTKTGGGTNQMKKSASMTTDDASSESLTSQKVPPAGAMCDAS
jgi:hypothetical protein